MDLQELTERPKTRWIALHGHLEGVELLVQSATPEESQKFSNKLRRDGITRPSRDNPLDVTDGRERDFFREFAAYYVKDWRGKIMPEGTPYDAKVMGLVMGAYRIAFEAVLAAVSDENAFFGNGPGEPTKN